MERRCPSCRRGVSEDAAFCSACGQRLALRGDGDDTPVAPPRAASPSAGSPVAAEGPTLTAGDLTAAIVWSGLGAGLFVSLPGLSLLNCCFCFVPVGAIVGPALGWAVRSRGRPISMRSFAVAALLAGLIAGVVAALGAYVTAMLTPAGDLEQARALIAQLQVPEELKKRIQETDWAKFNLLSLLVNLPLYGSTGAIVGVLGAYATARMMIADLVRDDE